MKSTGPFADARRALAVAVAGGFAVSAMACSAGGAPSQPTQPPAVAQPNAPQPAAAVNTPRLRISMITHAPPGDAFWDIIQTGAKDAAAKDNVEFLYSGDEDAGRQATLVQNAIDQKVDGIVVTLAKPDALEGVVKRAVAAGIPVVSINAGEDVSAQFGTLEHFGEPEEPAGEAAGQQLNKLGVKHALCVEQVQGHVGLEARCAGATKTFQGQVEKLFAPGTNMPQFRSTIASKLQADKSIDAVLTLCSACGLAAVQSVHDAGSTAKVAAFGLDKETVAAIKNSSLEFSVDQQPYLQGYLAVDGLWLHKKMRGIIGGGQPVLTGPSIVTTENVAGIEQFANQGLR